MNKIFKREKCKCGYERHEDNPKMNHPCPKCGAMMKYSEKWYYRIQINGISTMKAGYAQKRITEDEVGKIKSDVREGRYFNKIASTPWNTAVEEFQKWYSINVRPTTAQMYGSCLKSLSKAFGMYTLDRITVQMVERYKHELLSTGVTNSTVNRHLATIKRLYSLSVKWRFVESNYISSVEMLTENPPRDRFLTVEEKERLIKAVSESESPHLQLAVLISLDTGLRKDGVLSLKWSEVDFNTNIISKVGKGGKETKTPLTSRLKEILLDYKRNQKVLSQYILVNLKTGKPVKDLKHSFSVALKNAEINNVRWHDLRRTFGANFAMATKDLPALQKLLGHSSYNITVKHYAPLLDKQVSDAMKVYEQAVK